MRRLTKAMRDTLWIVAWDNVVKVNGRWVDSDGEPVDGRSLNALERRGLVIGHITGGKYTGCEVRCTEEGYELVEEMR